MDRPHENLLVCGPSGTGKTFLREALGQAAVEAGKHVAWFTLEQLGTVVRSHHADVVARHEDGQDTAMPQRQTRPAPLSSRCGGPSTEEDANWD